jgi:predicted Zn-dependent peptidase
VALVREHLGGVQRDTSRGQLDPPRPGPSSRILERDHEQVHVCLCAPGVARGNPRYRAQEVLSAIVGDGYSSRLFREVRDRRGLAYSVYSSCVGYLDCGSFNVYLGVAPERLAESLEVVRAVLTEVRDGGIDGQELEAAKTHLRGSMILGHESPGARVGFLAEQALLRAADLEFDVELAAFEQVALSDVRELAAEILAQPLAIAAVGAVPAGVLPEGGLRLPV